MNEKTGTSVSSEKENVKSQQRSVTPSLDTPSGAGLGRHKVDIKVYLQGTLSTLKMYFI